jgi:hypothetical protein
LEVYANLFGLHLVVHQLQGILNFAGDVAYVVIQLQHLVLEQTSIQQESDLELERVGGVENMLGQLLELYLLSDLLA